MTTSGSRGRWALAGGTCAAPSATHGPGTNQPGRGLLSRLMAEARNDMALVAVGVGGSIATAPGLLAAAVAIMAGPCIVAAVLRGRLMGNGQRDITGPRPRRPR